MRQQMINDDNLSIQWVDRKDGKYLVKFENLDVPIEMNDSYYNWMLRQIKN